MTVRVEQGDMREVLGRMVAEGVTVQSIVTDPPYHLTSIVKRFGADNAAPAKVGKTGAYARASAGFMGAKWDGGDVAFRPGTWKLCYDLLPPGGHLLAFSGTRTYHRMVMAIEEAGFEIRDTIAWLYGSGFPKSHNVSKGIDKAAGAEREVVGTYNAPGYAKANVENGAQNRTKYQFNKTSEEPATDAARQWEGWGTALKPALEPICLARKPLIGTVAGNVQKHGTGALNIDGCRIEHASADDLAVSLSKNPGRTDKVTSGVYGADRPQQSVNRAGRWPANVVHDGSDEVVSAFPDREVNTPASRGGSRNLGFGMKGAADLQSYEDNGSAARFFYSAKADAGDRLGSKHPTVKPVDLMRWLVRLITPPGGTVLDPFAGSGTTGMACMAEGFDCILVDSDPESIADIRRRIAHVRGDDTPLFKEGAA